MTRMKPIRFLAALLLVLACGPSCDTQFPRPGPRNVSLATSAPAAAGPGSHYDAYQWGDDTRRWVVLHSAGRGQTHSFHTFVLPCLERYLDGTATYYRLKSGAVVDGRIHDDGSASELDVLPLSADAFRGQEEGGRPVMQYNGPVGPRERTAGDGVSEPWLRFVIEPSKNRRRLVETVGVVYPALEGRADAREVVECFRPPLAGAITGGVDNPSTRAGDRVRIRAWATTNDLGRR